MEKPNQQPLQQRLHQLISKKALKIKHSEKVKTWAFDLHRAFLQTVSQLQV